MCMDSVTRTGSSLYSWVLQPLGNDDLATSHIRGRAPCVVLRVLVLLSKDHDMYDKELLETSNNFTEP